MYMVNYKYEERVGTRARVWNNKAEQTGGGLMREDLMKNPRGKIVSKKASATAKQANRLEKAGYVTKKGEFKLFSKK